jgi:hypothetical protein
VDEDGKTTLFSVLEVNVPSSASASAFRLNPNPARDILNLEWADPELGPLQVRLYDTEGRLLRSWKFNKEALTWDQSLDISGIPAGNYFINVEGTTIKENRQFIKE